MEEQIKQKSEGEKKLLHRFLLLIMHDLWKIMKEKNSSALENAQKVIGMEYLLKSLIHDGKIDSDDYLLKRMRLLKKLVNRNNIQEVEEIFDLNTQ